MVPTTSLLSVREISALVPMPRLLTELGFTVDERTRRAPCLLHSGSNRTAFAWNEDGRWHCFSCGAGGDRIALVRSVNRCSFRKSVTYLAYLAGIEFHWESFPRAELEQAQREKLLLRSSAEILLVAEKEAWRSARDSVLELEAIRRNAGERLAAINRGAQERWPGESDNAWDALAEGSRQMPHSAAIYCVISFAPANDRFSYALDIRSLEAAAERALENGYVADGKGYRFEVLL